MWLLPPSAFVPTLRRERQGGAQRCPSFLSPPFDGYYFLNIAYVACDSGMVELEGFPNMAAAFAALALFSWDHNQVGQSWPPSIVSLCSVGPLPESKCLSTRVAPLVLPQTVLWPQCLSVELGLRLRGGHGEGEQALLFDSPQEKNISKLTFKSTFFFLLFIFSFFVIVCHFFHFFIFSHFLIFLIFLIFPFFHFLHFLPFFNIPFFIFTFFHFATIFEISLYFASFLFDMDSNTTQQKAPPNRRCEKCSSTQRRGRKAGPPEKGLEKQHRLKEEETKQDATPPKEERTKQHHPTEEGENAAHTKRSGRKAAPRQRRGEKQHHQKKKETKQHHNRK